jgi:hypothetical protein
MNFAKKVTAVNLPQNAYLSNHLNTETPPQRESHVMILPRPATQNPDNRPNTVIHQQRVPQHDPPTVPDSQLPPPSIPGIRHGLPRRNAVSPDPMRNESQLVDGDDGGAEGCDCEVSSLASGGLMRLTCVDGGMGASSGVFLGNGG